MGCHGSRLSRSRRAPRGSSGRAAPDAGPLGVVAIAEITQSGIADPSDSEGKWAAVKLKPVRKLKRPVTLKEVKADPKLVDMELARFSRLSVAVVTPEEWDYVLSLSERKAS